MTDMSSAQTTALSAPSAPPAPPVMPEPQPETSGAHSATEENVEPVPEPGRQPQQPPLPVRGSQQERTLNLLRQRLVDLRVPEHTYRIGEPAAQTWYLEEVEDGWQVGWFDGEFTSPMQFEEIADASAFLLGKLLLGVPAESALRDDMPLQPPVPQRDDRGDETADLGDPMTDQGARHDLAVDGPAEPLDNHVEPHVDHQDDLQDELLDGLHGDAHHDPHGDMRNDMRSDVRNDMRSDVHGDMHSDVHDDGHTLVEPPQQQVEERIPDVVPERAAEPVPPPAEWPIQPLNGEPPLTLFRGKRMLELQPGTEVDRFGGPEGNLTYVAGTPFEQRSLVPEWVHRPYHLYRVTRPLQALTGGAIPWFDQPGGGTAYLLPRAVEELLSNGDLVEVDQAEPPVS